MLFGSTAAASFTVVSPTQIKAVPPPGTPGTVDVTVANPDGLLDEAVRFQLRQARTAERLLTCDHRLQMGA